MAENSDAETARLLLNQPHVQVQEAGTEIEFRSRQINHSRRDYGTIPDASPDGQEGDTVQGHQPDGQEGDADQGHQPDGQEGDADQGHQVFLWGRSFIINSLVVCDIPPQDNAGDSIKCYHRVLFWISKPVTIFVIIIMLFGVLQAVCSWMRWQAIHHCNATNSTTKTTQDKFYQFTGGMYSAFSVVHALAAALIFIQYMNKEKRKLFCKGFDVCNLPRRYDSQFWCGAIFPYFIFLFLFCMSLTITIIGLWYDFKDNHCNYSHLNITAIISYHFLLNYTTTVVNIVLLMLLFATVCVYDIWTVPGGHDTTVRREENDAAMVTGMNTLPYDYFEYTKRATLDYKKTCLDYQKRGNTVIEFTSIFDAWFVLHWFIYFLGTFVDLTFVIRPWALGRHNGSNFYKVHKLDYVYIALFTMYDFLVFIVPFGCGLTMNYFHNYYYKDLVKKREKNFAEKTQKEKEESAFMYAFNNAVLPVKKVEEFDFTPSIFGVDLPLTNPGYVLSIILAMVTLILGFLVTDPLN